jgi:thiol-disulfide isomerase/thioredoxin
MKIRFSYFSAMILGESLLALALVGSVQAVHADQTIELKMAPPALVGGPWLNTPQNKPITLASRKGKVTVVEFWNFGCINCRHNLPFYAGWQKRFAKDDVAIIGIHTPETDGERSPAKVMQRVKDLGITYPILLDQKGTNWNRWDQQFWPTVYLIDKQGRIRYRWDGELEYQHAGGEAIMAQHIEELLREK